MDRIKIDYKYHGDVVMPLKYSFVTTYMGIRLSHYLGSLTITQLTTMISEVTLEFLIKYVRLDWCPVECLAWLHSLVYTGTLFAGN